MRLEERRKGQSMMDFRDIDEVEDADEHLLEIVTDTSRRPPCKCSNLIDSKVRSQKATALSSGESEFMALVAGGSEGMLVRHLWNKIIAARGMTIGRVRRLDASEGAETRSFRWHLSPQT